MKKQLDAS
ncbi:Protein of unknown function [Bacillus mycoides]|nr:Protein of unknown function [Bacillus mycoides]SCM85641.1 Protein of unknown function [Bacillus mycoides]